MKIRKALFLLAITSLGVACTSDQEHDVLENSHQDNSRIDPLVLVNDPLEDQLHWVSFAIAEALAKDNAEVNTEITNLVATHGDVLYLNDIFNATVHTRQEMITTINREMRPFCVIPHPDLNVSKPSKTVIAVGPPPPSMPTSQEVYYESQALSFWNDLIANECIEVRFINGLSVASNKVYYATAHPLAEVAFNTGYKFDEELGYGSTCGKSYFWTLETESLNISGLNVLNKHIVLARPYRSLSNACDYNHIDVDDFELFPDNVDLGL